MDVGVFRGVPLNLSKAANLKCLNFMWERSSVQWITMTPQTVKSKSLQDITVYPNGALPETIGEEVHWEWQNLDQLLVQFWSTHSICPQIVYMAGKGGDSLRDCVLSLLLELTKRRLIDLVETAT